MIYGLFPKYEWVSDDNNRGIMCPYRYFLCRAWSCFMIRLKDLPFQSFSGLCLHMPGRIGEAWMRIQLSRNLFTSSTRWFWDENSEDDPPHGVEKISSKMLCSQKINAYKILQCQTPLMSQGTASSKTVCAEISLILDPWVCWWILTLPSVPQSI